VEILKIIMFLAGAFTALTIRYIIRKCQIKHLRVNSIRKKKEIQLMKKEPEKKKKQKSYICIIRNQEVFVNENDH